ncbi:hypothetical protein IDJ77_25400 [Mucilaginibacter sp. ZT4R22]|uniref:DUF6922 domain-containing protein n=1 Tax=Mucilaginibacter pankratovii TaxID=2772110 RepID=A0ABR7WY99_9SPHI|nr:hypothetical protein [Mucilaginibacter pankratovii]MBD1367173.1 hypothetical protein [Mucilaginibacter pankratovii]
MDKPILSKQAFWDVDMDKIDYEKNARYVMERVLNNGTEKDFRALVNFYGHERWRTEIVNSKVLDARDANFCCTIFNIDIKDFKYDIKPFVREPWDYSGA